MAGIIKKCPVCNNELRISTLYCSECGLELKNDFEMSAFDRLPAEQYSFLIEFLRNQGNLKSLQKSMNISYPTAKKKLMELLCSLRLAEVTAEELEEINMEKWEIKTDSSRASDIVKSKLVSCGGKASIYTIKGKKHDIWVIDEEHFACDAVKPTSSPKPFDFDIFNVIVELLRSQGGKAKKGCGRSKLGSPKCGEDTVAGAILKNYFHKNLGETALAPEFLMISILEWAGLVKNEWGYIELTAYYRLLLEGK